MKGNNFKRDGADFVPVRRCMELLRLRWFVPGMPQPPKDNQPEKPRGGSPPIHSNKLGKKSGGAGLSTPRWRNAKGQFTKRETPGSKPAWKHDS